MGKFFSYRKKTDQVGKYIHLVPTSDELPLEEVCERAVAYKENKPDDKVTVTFGPAQDYLVPRGTTAQQLEEQIMEMYVMDDRGLDPDGWKL